jgi:hypothetical protein
MKHICKITFLLLAAGSLSHGQVQSKLAAILSWFEKHKLVE